MCLEDEEVRKKSYYVPVVKKCIAAILSTVIFLLPVCCLSSEACVLSKHIMVLSCLLIFFFSFCFLSVLPTLSFKIEKTPRRRPRRQIRFNQNEKDAGCSFLNIIFPTLGF